ncbi:hypothetical protein [Pseudomonas lactis]|uniref:Uncharacterized protein n=1 Tax=Pseudomonas lactis TaxID=1615674 RepID=I4KCU8_9PSED|nr:hypothetical protein [Pseudomonas lactis]EIK62538.1 hypothetical protein PflSS101_3709 [Pseudomonas lactis]NNA71954.1 hypothetical protein [Pseudomonas lactis]NNA78554.1 hypothetical protein [Pseudomonas lactis]
MAKQTSTPETPSSTDNASTPQNLESITAQPQALEVAAPIISSELYGTITTEAMKKGSYLTVDSRMDRSDIIVKFRIEEEPDITFEPIVDSSGVSGTREIPIPLKYLTRAMRFTLVLWYEGAVGGKPAVSLAKYVTVNFYPAEQSKALAPKLRDEKIVENTPRYDMHDHEGDEKVDIPIPDLAQEGDKIYCSVITTQFEKNPASYLVVYGYALTLEDIKAGQNLEFSIPRGWLARQKPTEEAITCHAGWITSGLPAEPPKDTDNPDEKTFLPANALDIQYRRTAQFIGDQGLEDLQPPHLRQSAFFDDKWCLNPELTKNGGDVDAPELDTYAGDQICFYVSGPGYGSKSLGCVEIQNDGEQASVKLPRCVIACFFNKPMALSYTVRFPNLMGPEPQSPERVVNVLKPKLSQSEIAEATHGKVNLNIFSEDATAFVQIGDYATCANYCWAWITGTHEHGSDYRSDILIKEPVTEDWMNKGVETFIPRDKLQKMDDCSDFELHFAFSFCEASERSDAIETPAAKFHIIQEDLVLLQPTVDKAQDNELEPWNARDGLEVTVSYLRMSGKHEIALCWERPNGLYWTLEPQPGSREGVVKFLLPAEAVIESMGKTPKIIYTVTTTCREKAQTSLPLNLKINLPTRLNAPNVLEATPPETQNAILDTRIFAGNANSHEDPMWFLRAGQKCWLRAKGTDKNDSPYTFDIYADRTITPQEVTEGVGYPVLRSELDKLKDNTQLTLTFSVATDASLNENVVCPSRTLVVRVITLVTEDFTTTLPGYFPAGSPAQAPTMTITARSGIVGIHAASPAVPGMTSGNAIALSCSTGTEGPTPSQSVDLFLKREYLRVRFAFTRNAYYGVCYFYGRNGELLGTRSGLPVNSWVDFSAPDGKLISKISVVSQQHSYLDSFQFYY